MRARNFSRRVTRFFDSDSKSANVACPIVQPQTQTMKACCNKTPNLIRAFLTVHKIGAIPHPVWALAVCAAFTAVGVAVLDDYGVSSDEFYQRDVAAPTPEEGPALSTHLYALESESVRLERFDGRGGAMESMGEDLLVVTPKGRFALVFPDGTAEYLDGNVPMNAASLGQHDDYDRLN